MTQDDKPLREILEEGLDILEWVCDSEDWRENFLPWVEKVKVAIEYVPPEKRRADKQKPRP